MRSSRPRCLLTVIVALIPVLVAISVPASAQAAFGFAPGSVSVGLSTNVAGAHPDLTTRFAFSRVASGAQQGEVDGSLRDLDFDLPPGLIGDPNAASRCTMAQVITASAFGECPRDSAVGFVKARVTFPGNAGDAGEFNAPVYNITPYADQPAAFAFNTALPVRLDVYVRSDGDYGIRATASDITESAQVVDIDVTLWGVPADRNGEGPLVDTTSPTFRTFGGPGPGTRRPFLSNPTSCGKPLTAHLQARPWDPARGVSNAAADLGAVEGCENLTFEPSLTVRPETTEPGAPSGYTIDVDLPQNREPSGTSAPTLRDATVTLPPGVSISPSAANGLSGCTSDQFGLRSLAATACPNGSKVGRLSITSPLLPGAISGDVYVGQPQPGNTYRLFLAVEGYGVRVKLEGRVSPDPVTGQLRATFEQNPELPFSNLHLEFAGGPNAVLANPTTCGTQTVTSSLVAHGGQAARPSAAYSITCPGIAGFAPTFQGGSTNVVAGAFTNFGVRVNRPDSSQFMDGLEVILPTGLLAKLRDVPICPEASAAAGTCGTQSRVGTATVAAGPGSQPFVIKGAASLAGPYKGAPYSLSTVVPAIAGPYNLGTVVVRQALYIDPVDAQIKAVSDPFPTILQGIPLRLRSINLDVDRPGFALNPTSCAAKYVQASIKAIDLRHSDPRSRFQATECASLGFTPKLNLRLTGKNALTDGRHPAVKAILTQPKAQAGISKVSVKLPLSLALDPDNAQSLCEFRDGILVDPKCSKKSIVGSAKAFTPILGKPLTAPVYFVKNQRIGRGGRVIRTLPMLVIPLRGSNIKLNLRGTTSVSRGRLVTTFATVPDAPVTRFDLKINGGSNGIIVANTSVCKASRTAGVGFRSHSGRRLITDPTVATSCTSGK